MRITNKLLRFEIELGYDTEPWTCFDILHRIELAVGNEEAAQTAWVQARSTYLAYRTQGAYAETHPLERGSFIYIPIVEWHGLRNADPNERMEVLEVISRLTSYLDRRRLGPDLRPIASGRWRRTLTEISAALEGTADVLTWRGQSS